MIGESLRIQGTLTSNEEIVVNGELSGQLQMNHRLTIGAKGKVEAGKQPAKPSETKAAVAVATTKTSDTAALSSGTAAG